MYSLLTSNGHRRELHRLITTRRIIVVAFLGAAASLALVSSFPKASAQANRVSPAPTPTPVSPVQEPLPVPSVAPGYEADKATYPQLALIGVSFDRQETMTLKEAVELALRNNKDIEVSRSVVRSAEATLRGAEGFYDPKLTFNRYFFREVQSVSSSTLGGDQGSIKINGTSGGVSFFGLAPKGGGQYSLSFTDSQIKTNVIFATLDKQYKTNLTFSYTQPLLRNRKIDEPRRQIEIAKKNLSLTDAQFRTNVIEIITHVRNSYWDLVYSLRNLQIQQDALRAAEEQLLHTRRLVGRGYVPPIDVTQVEAQVSNFREGLYMALQGVAKSDVALKNLIVGDIKDPLWNVLIIPTDPVDLQAPAISAEQAFDDAMTQRPELQQADVAKAINDLNQRFYSDQKRPQIDLVGSYSLDGLAGRVNPLSGQDPIEFASTDLTNRVNQLSLIAGLPPLPPPVNTATVPPFLVGSYGQSLTNLFSNRFPTVRFGIQVELPIWNRKAEANLALAREEGAQLKTRRDQLDQLIKVDVRTALQAMRTAEARLRASAEARAATEQQYESEVRLYNGGHSTTYLVLDRQMSVKNARGVELKAQMDLNKSISDLDRAIGRTVKSFDFILDVH